MSAGPTSTIRATLHGDVNRDDLCKVPSGWPCSVRCTSTTRTTRAGRRGRGVVTVGAMERVDYVDTFIAVPDDSMAAAGVAPPISEGRERSDAPAWGLPPSWPSTR